MPRMSRSAILAVGSSLVTACGANVSGEASDGAVMQTGDSAIDTNVMDSAPTFDTNVDSALPEGSVIYGSPPAPDPACDATAAKLSELVTSDACATIVRVSYGGTKVLGWQIRCDVPGPLSESSARMELGPYVAPPTRLADYKWVTTSSPDPWVLFHAPSDFGGVGVGSFHTGKLLFAGGVVWSGRGDITFPSTFRPGSELDMTCAATSFSWVPRYFTTASEMGDVAVSIAGVVYQSPLPHALKKRHSSLHAWVLGYARTVGVFDPAGAEWIVVVESTK